MIKGVSSRGVGVATARVQRAVDPKQLRAFYRVSRNHLGKTAFVQPGRCGREDRRFEDRGRVCRRQVSVADRKQGGGNPDTPPKRKEPMRAPNATCPSWAGSLGR